MPRPADWAPGPPAWWRAPVVAPSERWLEVVPPTGSAPIAPAFPDARASAVLVAIADGPAGAEVLLTKRSMALRHHRGEVSFPGGRMDPHESPVDTALREAWEEVGLDPTLVEPVGELAHLNTVVSKSYIVPVVAALPEPVVLAPMTGEVDTVWWQPLADLMRTDTYRSERWGRPPLDRLLHFFDLDDETIWGATAHMLVDLIGRVVVPAADAGPSPVTRSG
ncbi:MAG: CoA pyrophosphatase [Ilumatobacteraceae bacterium]|nr:CoA pyrophosphatase [Ilumatobacteraceae bacterium]